MPWCNVVYYQNIYTNNFCNNLFVIDSNCCPIKEKEITFARLRKPWISDDIISLNRKHALFRQYKNGIVTFDHYNSFKNNFTTTLRLAKNNYFQRKFTECSNNSRDTWKTLNSLIRCKKAVKMLPWTTMAPPSVTPQSLPQYLMTIFQT